MKLDEIAIKHGTDKATKHPVLAGHCYTPHYDRVFEPLRDKEIMVLEIGVGGGESIKTWLEYFTKAKVFGVDIVTGTNPWNTVNSGAHERYTYVNGDQSHDVFWKCFVASFGGAWNIIIDDGSHYAHHVIESFKCLWPSIATGGLYCIEDLAVSYGGHPFTQPGKPTHMDFLRSIMDETNKGNDVDWMNFSRELAIIKKK